MKIFYLPAWLALGTALLATRTAAQVVPPAPETGFALVKKQFRQSRWQLSPHNNEASAVSKTSAEQIAHWIQSQNTDGRWNDIDYADQTRNFWRTEQHLRRTAELAAAYAKIRDHGQDDPLLRKAILQATSYWITQDFRNPNWWHNEIGVPDLLSDIMLIMEPEMTPEQKAGGLKILARSTLSRTGQNLVWQALVVFKTAMLREDATLARQADERILPQLGASGGEGLQIDESFHQHGPQQQLGNYGLAFATEMVEWAWIWRGTPWALPDARLAVLRGFLLGGEGVVVANSKMDISACGRQFFPGSPAGKGKGVLTILQIMAAVDPLHAADYQAAIREDSTGAGNARDNHSRQIEGVLNRDYYRSDYMVQRRPGFYASVKMCSRRVIGTEKVNDENIQGRYMADGATFVYRTGQEYTDIFPVWDWRRIPGVTCAKDGGGHRASR